MFDVLA